jgi:hypothetical protein
MAQDINGQPSSQPDDGSHISKEVRAALKDQPPEIAEGVRRVADADKSRRLNLKGAIDKHSSQPPSLH